MGNAIDSLDDEFIDFRLRSFLTHRSHPAGVETPQYSSGGISVGMVLFSGDSTAQIGACRARHSPKRPDGMPMSFQSDWPDK